jgi:hypothetical protein
MIDSQITDAKNGNQAKVTNAGQLVTSPIEYSTPKFVSLASDNVGYTFFEPKDGKKFVITDVIAIADRNVTTSCIIDIYEADDLDSATIGTSIFQLDLLKNDKIVMTGLNIITSAEGIFINGKTDDNNGLVTISGYYIDA